KKSWKVNLYGGINHQAYWGNETEVYGDAFKLTKMETFFYVFLGRAYHEPGLGSSKIGNQLGSIDMGLSYDFEKLRLFGYRQSFYVVGAISRLANIRDGLNGIALENINHRGNRKNWNWKKLIIEFFYSKDQAGYPWSKPTKSGDEDYYNNSYYLEGWSYKGTGVGNPLVIPATDAKEGQVSSPLKYFISNRISALHLGIDFQLFETNIFFKTTYARHHGNFATSPWGSSLGRTFRKPYGLFVPVSQFSAYLKANRNLRSGFSMGLVLAADHGNMLNNSVGGFVSLAKQW